MRLPTRVFGLPEYEIRPVACLPDANICDDAAKLGQLGRLTGNLRFEFSDSLALAGKNMISFHALQWATNETGLQKPTLSNHRPLQNYLVTKQPSDNFYRVD